MSFILKVLEILDKLPEPLKSLFIILGIIFTIHLIFKVLVKTFRTVENIVQIIELKIYYPVISRLIKREHKEYVRKYLKNLVSYQPSVSGMSIEYDIDVEWSDEERVLIDLEKGMLVVRMPYTTNLHRVVAKALLMISPYAVSQYLEPIFGSTLAQLLSITVARDYASRDVNVLREFVQYVHEVYKENKEFEKLIEYINKADDESLYKHIVLFELKKVLETYNGHVDKDELENDIKTLIEIVGSLPDVSEPLVCGYYISLAIARVGKLEKVLFGEWDRYVQYIKTCMQKCKNIKRIYVISAGKIIKEIAKEFTDYLVSNVSGIKLLAQVSYKARYYKGRPSVPRYIAIFEVE